MRVDMPKRLAIRQAFRATGSCSGLAWEPLAALRIATDFFNWDLEAHGQTWRLGVHDAHVEQS